MAFTGTALRTAKLDLTLLGCESLITCSPLVRLGDKGQTIISARISNGDPALDLAGWVMGFEATVGDKLIRDENQSRFRLVGKNTVEYKCSDEVHSFIGTVNVAYFTLKKDGTTATTQNFSIHSLQNAETGTDGLKEHYVSVIDDLVKSNGEAIGKAEEIKGLIDKNQVVRKSGDTMSGNLEFDRTKGVLFKNGDGISVMSLTSDNLNRFVGFSDAANENVFVYDPATKFFDLRSGTNLIKTTGGTMTGYLRMDTESGEKGLIFKDNTSEHAKLYGSKSRNVGLLDIAKNSRVWEYDATSKVFSVYSDTNLLKKTGDTMTGNLVFQGDGERGITFRTLTDNREYLKVFGNPSGNRFGVYSTYKGKTIINYDGSADSFTLDVANTNIVTKNKNGTVTMPLENGATPVGSRDTFAIREGNTVTLQLNAKRTSSADSQICVLPSDMRPSKMLVSYLNGVTAGTNCQIVINTNGAIQFHNNNVDISGVITYVVN